ncbi:MAG TPA: DNA-processing protein DprA [Candidatus Saccharimonadales bacterium]|nr:DNA-processing protein DprA [Candidatus Saccharimonadales bacterium]
MNVNTLTLNTSGYPLILADIGSPPPQLFWAGASPDSWLGAPRVAIVGSRKATTYGIEITRKLAGQLASAGVVVISGMAMGIDSAAHQAALGAGGITVAVLGTSLSDASKSSRANLANQILNQGGTIISEYSAQDIVQKSNFVIRNRIVSGLADVVVITEAALKSGSLHTARFALEQGKTVMAVPGNINQLSSQGSNNLIKSGAIPITEVDDIFFALKISPVKAKRPRRFQGSPSEAIIFKLIQAGVSGQEELAAAARLAGPVVASSLTMLEISGYIRPAGAGHWVTI